MRRAVLLACALASVSWACTQDFGIFDPKGDASSGGNDAGDGGSDAASPGDGGDGAVPTCNLPSACQTDAAACGQTCTSAYNTCVTNCGGSTPCKNQCKNSQNSCFMQCQNACEGCSGQGTLCASACQTAVGF